MMGVGQVVTLRLPASRLREVNRILETTGWGSYRTRRSASRRTTRRNRSGRASAAPKQVRCAHRRAVVVRGDGAMI
jgi:hypothetical protein